MAWSPQGTFFIFGGCSVVSVFFIYFFVGETKGLSEKEKKEIFMPGANYGRKLREGEQALAELGDEHKSKHTIIRERLSAPVKNSAIAKIEVDIERKKFVSCDIGESMTLTSRGTEG